MTKVSRLQPGRDGNSGIVILNQGESASRHGSGTRASAGGNETGGNTITRNGIKWIKVTEDGATVKREVGPSMTDLAGSRRGQGTATGKRGSAHSRQFGGGMRRGYGGFYSGRGTPLSSSNARSAEVLADDMGITRGGVSGGRISGRTNTAGNPIAGMMTRVVPFTTKKLAPVA